MTTRHSHSGKRAAHEQKRERGREHDGAHRQREGYGGSRGTFMSCAVDFSSIIGKPREITELRESERGKLIIPMNEIGWVIHRLASWYKHSHNLDEQKVGKAFGLSEEQTAAFVQISNIIETEPQVSSGRSFSFYGSSYYSSTPRVSVQSLLAKIEPEIQKLGLPPGDIGEQTEALTTFALEIRRVANIGTTPTEEIQSVLALNPWRPKVVAPAPQEAAPVVPIAQTKPEEPPAPGNPKLLRAIYGSDYRPETQDEPVRREPTPVARNYREEIVNAVVRVINTLGEIRDRESEFGGRFMQEARGNRLFESRISEVLGVDPVDARQLRCMAMSHHHHHIVSIVRDNILPRLAFGQGMSEDSLASAWTLRADRLEAFFHRVGWGFNSEFFGDCLDIGARTRPIWRRMR